MDRDMSTARTSSRSTSTGASDWAWNWANTGAQKVVVASKIGNRNDKDRTRCISESISQNWLKLNSAYSPVPLTSSLCRLSTGGCRIFGRLKNRACGSAHMRGWEVSGPATDSYRIQSLPFAVEFAGGMDEASNLSAFVRRCGIHHMRLGYADMPANHLPENLMPTPPFRADHVGSLLRPEKVAEARRRHFEEKSLSANELKEVEDEAIIDLIRMQEDVGLKAVTDGEQRRSFWHYDFMGMLTGLDLVEREEGVQFAGVKLRPIFPTITARLDFPDDHPMLEHFKFVAVHTGVVPKISIPGPSCCHFRTAAKDIYPAEYQDIDVLLSDIARTYKKAVQAFYDAGCRYLQMDDIFFAYLCDPKHREAKKAEGQDPDYLIDRYAWMMHEAIKDRPEDMIIGMHMCRGNFRSTYAAEGAYDPAADAVFNKTGVDVFFMEYDTDRAGGLEPLRLLQKGKQRVLPGFITTKTGELEDMDWLKAKFDEASKYADINQLGIAPQCGFASTEEGNAISAEDQRRKLELVVATAEEIWGGVEN